MELRHYIIISFLCLFLTTFLGSFIFVNNSSNNLGEHKRTFYLKIMVIITNFLILFDFLSFIFKDNISIYLILLTLYNICSIIFMGFSYVYMLTLIPICLNCIKKNEKIFGCVYSLLIVPNIISLIYQLISKNYSTLIINHCLYFNVLFTIILGIITFSLRKQYINKNIIKKNSRLIPIFLIFMILYFVYGELNLIMNFLYPSIILLYYILFHNSNIDIITGGSFNKDFIHDVSKILGKKDYYVFSIEIENYNNLEILYSEYIINNYILNFVNFLTSKVNLKIYRAEENKISMIIYDTSKENMLKIFNQIIEKYRDDSLLEDNNNTIKVNFKISIVDVGYNSMNLDIFNWINNLNFDRCNINDFWLSNEEDFNKALRFNTIKENFFNLLGIKSVDDIVNVYYQPILDNKEKKFLTMEALVRLKINDVIYFPDEFIPYLEQNNKIHSLSLVVLDKVCRFIKELDNNNIPIDGISVNISSIELLEPRFKEDIINTVNKYDINPNKIHIEITESAIIMNEKKVSIILNELKDFGFSFYLDDFGTGYSDLNRIIRYSFNVVKFDKSLVWLTSENKKNYEIIFEFVHLLKNNGYKILFEGIENNVNETIVNDMGIDYSQGYLYSKPIDEQSTIKFLKDKLN